MTVTRAGLALLLAAPLLLAGCNKKQEEAKAPAAAATAPAGYRVYATNETSDSISIIDGATNKVVDTVPVGKRPRAIRPSFDGKTLFITLSGSPIAGPDVDEDKMPPPDRSADGIAIFDIAQNKVVRVITGVMNPEQIAITHSGKIFAGSEDSSTVEGFDIATGAKVGSFKVPGSPEGVAVTPDDKFIYATSEDGEKVYVVDAETLSEIAALPVGGRPRSMTISPDGNRAYVTAEVGKSLAIIDARRHTLLNTLRFPGDPMLPMGVVVSPDNKRVYVSTGRGGSILVIDAESFRTLKSIKVGNRPWGVALSPDGKFLYAANGTSNDVSVVNTETLEEVAKIPAGNRPWGVAVVAEAAKAP